ncbi:integral membrane protein [Podospora didyma]|uniref:Integral membrane protein n=1 Tax=Podospora didyma TaxID=330526 RepID=A0AAE0NQK3_9PEZI|nr:integral membrane protein [Podospora didyma]
MKTTMMMAARAADPPPADIMNENRGGVMIGLSVAFIVLTSIVVPLRFYARAFRSTSFGLDDGLIIAAYFVNLALCGVGIALVLVGGVGQHVAAVQLRDPHALTNWAKFVLLFEFVYFTAVALPKLSILCLYLRVFNWTEGPMRRATQVMFGLVLATWFSMMVTASFQCQPLAYWWDPTIKGGRCIDVQAFYHAQSVPGFVLDIFIMALPIRTIWSLKMPTVKKVALVLVFLVASLGVIASIIRAATFFNNAALQDRTWASVLLCGWSVVESGCYIIANCLSHLRPLISRFAPQWIKNAFQSTFKSISHSTSSHPASKVRSHTTKKAAIAGNAHQEEDTLELRSMRYKEGGYSTPSMAHEESFPPVGGGHSGTGIYVHIDSPAGGTYAQPVPRTSATDGSGAETPGWVGQEMGGGIQVTTEVTTRICRQKSLGYMERSGRYV